MATRVNQIEPFRVMELMARADQLEQAGRHIIHLEVGESEFPTPPGVIAQGHHALDHQTITYTDAKGIAPLRRKISQYYRDEFKLKIDSERILITSGASGGLMLLAAALVEPGERWLLADPGYPCYRHFIQLMGGKAELIACEANANFQLSAAQIASHWQHDTRGVIIGSPANPTGSVIEQQALAEICQQVKNRDGIVIVDEIYQGLTYDGVDFSVLQLDPNVLVINSFSKFFTMTGWRLGWLVLPLNLVETIEKLAQNFYISPSSLSQHAAMAAFTPENLQLLHRRRDAYRQRRDFLVDALREIGFGIPYQPMGAFYIYADISEFSVDSYQFCLDLLEQAGVAITPGNDFGHYRANEMVRFSYTRNLAQLQSAVEKLKCFLAQR